MLTTLEILVLCSVRSVGEKAYGTTVREEVEKSRKRTSLGMVYVTLDRLVAQDLLKTSFGDPTPERGGRRKKFFALTAKGTKQLEESLRIVNKAAQS